MANIKISGSPYPFALNVGTPNGTEVYPADQVVSGIRKTVSITVAQLFASLSVTYPTGLVTANASMVINGAPATTGLIINPVSGVTGISIQGNDIAVGVWNSSSTANRSQMNFQQGAVAQARIGADGTQSMLSDSVNSDMCLVSAGHAIRFGTTAGSTTRMQLTNAGNLLISTPTSGTTPTIAATAIANAYAGQFVAGGTVGGSNGIFIRAGTSSSDGPLSITNAAQSQTLFNIDGIGQVTIGAPVSTGIALSIGGLSAGVTMTANVASTVAQFAQIGTIGSSGGDYPYMGYNFRATTTAGSYNYVVADTASAIQFNSGALTFKTAPSGASGGAITWTNRMFIGAGTIGLFTRAASSTGTTQITGWGTPTGPVVVTNFNGAAGTLVNCSNAIAKIITDLIAFGIYAA